MITRVNIWRVFKTLRTQYAVFRIFSDFFGFLDNKRPKHHNMTCLGVIFAGELISGVGLGF
jgi:hypothetical protein